MKVITLINNKGGVGKTSSVVNLAYSLADMGKKVLLIDMDPQSNASGIFSKINYIHLFTNMVNKAEKTHYSIEDVLLDDRVTIQEAVKSTSHPNLDYIPTYLTLSETETRMNLDIRQPQQYRLRNKIHTKEVKETYDCILIDCSPSLSVLNINALVASTDVYIPIKTDGCSVLGIPMTLNLIKDVQKYQYELKYRGCFFTMFNERKNVSKEMIGFLNAFFPASKVLDLHIGVSKLIEEGSVNHKVLLEYDPKKKEKITNQYIELAQYMVSQED